MENIKKILKRILYPNKIVPIILIPLSAMLLIYAFLKEPDNSPIAIAAYAVSAYALALLVVYSIDAYRFFKSALHNNRYAARYLSEREYRARLSLYSGFAGNTVYAVFRLVTGIIYSSDWSLVLAGYYIILSLMRFTLTKSIRNTAEDKIREWKSYQRCGIMMFLLNCAMITMTVYMIWKNKTHTQQGLVIYASATYTFYSITIAIVNIIRFRRIGNPTLSAAKAISFAGALMSVFALQTSMLSEFGGIEDFSMEMNCITGGFVCITVLFMAVFMIIRSVKQLKILYRRGDYFE